MPGVWRKGFSMPPPISTDPPNDNAPCFAQIVIEFLVADAETAHIRLRDCPSIEMCDRSGLIRSAVIQKNRKGDRQRGPPLLQRGRFRC